MAGITQGMTLRFATCRREGFDAGTHPEFARFLSYAQRSCTEVQSELYVALDQEYVDESTFRKLYNQAEMTKRKIGGLIRYLKASPVSA